MSEMSEKSGEVKSGLEGVMERLDAIKDELEGLINDLSALKDEVDDWGDFDIESFDDDEILAEVGKRCLESDVISDMSSSDILSAVDDQDLATEVEDRAEAGNIAGYISVDTILGHHSSSEVANIILDEFPGIVGEILYVYLRDNSKEEMRLDDVLAPDLTATQLCRLRLGLNYMLDDIDRLIARKEMPDDTPDEFVGE